MLFTVDRANKPECMPPTDTLPDSQALLYCAGRRVDMDMQDILNAYHFV